MRTLIMGAGGYVGSAVARVLAEAGHEVSGLARTPDAIGRLQASGYGAAQGDMSDLPALAREMLKFDAIVFTARILFAEEPEVLGALVSALEGTGKTFIYVSGTGVMAIDTPLGEWRDEAIGERDAFVSPPWILQRVKIENDILGASRRGVRSMVIRPPHIWGHGGSTTIRALFAGIRQIGAAGYVGYGLNAYAHVHVDDLADLFLLALEHGEAGATYNAVGGEANFRALAHAAAEVMGCKARSLTIDEAKDIWGQWMGPVLFGMSCPARGPQARALGWSPRHIDIEVDIREGGYREMEGDPNIDQAAQRRLGVKAG